MWINLLNFWTGHLNWHANSMVKAFNRTSFSREQIYAIYIRDLHLHLWSWLAYKSCRTKAFKKFKEVFDVITITNIALFGSRTTSETDTYDNFMQNLVKARKGLSWKQNETSLLNRDRKTLVWQLIPINTYMT